MLADFADEFDAAVGQERLHSGLVIFYVDLVDLGRYLERHAGPGGNSDGGIGSFFRRNAPQKSEVSARAGPFREQVLRQPVVYRRDVVRLRQRGALRIRNGHYRHVVVHAVESREFRQVQPAMQRGKRRSRET